MDSMQLDPETVDNQDMYSHIPPILMEKCAALSVRPDTVKNLVQSMQGELTGTSKGLGLSVFPPGCSWGISNHHFFACINSLPLKLPSRWLFVVGDSVLPAAEGFGASWSALQAPPGHKPAFLLLFQCSLGCSLMWRPR